jgi:hypothetical protein
VLGAELAAVMNCLAFPSFRERSSSAWSSVNELVTYRMRGSPVLMFFGRLMTGETTPLGVSWYFFRLAIIDFFGVVRLEI